jgi:hypothetical protein
MTLRQDSSCAQWRLARARALMGRAQTRCSEGDLDRACALAVHALAQLPLQLVKSHMPITWRAP